MSFTLTSTRVDGLITNPLGAESISITLQSTPPSATYNGDFDNFEALTRELLQVPKSAIDEVHASHA